jgi:RND superfamily putative drug exporter
VVVAFWILVVAALGGLAGKLQGAEKNDASAYLPSSAESTQELNEQNLFQSKNLNPALKDSVKAWKDATVKLAVEDL